jgi:hypothetical protein
MASGIEAHRRDLENEAREAERDLDELQDRVDHRIEEMNNEIREHVARIQKEKQRLREQLERKKQILKKKLDEVAAFQVCSQLIPHSSRIVMLTYQLPRRLYLAMFPISPSINLLVHPSPQNNHRVLH